MQNIELRKNELLHTNRVAGRTKLVLGLVLALSSIGFGMQIWLSGEIATAGEQIKEYEERKQILLTENARLTEQLQTQTSLSSIQATAEEMGFVKVNPDQISHLVPLDSFASLSSQ